MARPRKLQEGETMEMDEMLVRNAVFSLKTKPASTTGDITVQAMNEILSDFIAQGYKIISANAYSGDSDSVQVYVCMAKQ